MTQTVFIDGAAGTTGLEIAERLAGRSEFSLIALPDAERAQVREQMLALIATHPALRGQAVVRFPYTTLAFHCVRH